MKYLKPLLKSLDVAPIVAELDTHPELWNRYKLRTSAYGSPHSGVSDVWVRYRDWWELRDSADPKAIAEWAASPHESVWYAAIDVLPALRALIFDLMRALEVERLGGVLITRIPPGGRVDWHRDAGWHAEYYADKIGILLRGNEERAFCYRNGEFRCGAGDGWTFDNSEEHRVTNGSPVERITLIMCARRDQRKPTLVRAGD